MALTAEEIKQALGLQKHPTCGFTTLSYLSPHKLPNDVLPEGYAGSHTFASVLYFLVSPDAKMVLHRLRSDQMYHHYLGDPLEVLMLLPDGTGKIVVLGTDLLAGERPQLLIPGGTWHVSRVANRGAYALLGTTEWPGFDPSDLEVADIEQVIAHYPTFAEQIRDFTASD